MSNPESWTGKYGQETGKTDWPSMDIPETSEEFPYEFVGWADKNNVMQTDVPARYTAVETTFHGVWRQVGYAVITLDWGFGGQKSMLTGPEGDALEDTKFPTVTREGYTLRGWVDEDGRFATSLIDTYRDYTYLAMWTASQSVISYDANGGKAVASKVGKTDGTIKDRTLPTTTKTGYTFDGWYDNDQLTGDAVEQLPGKFPAGGATYYAKWAPATSEFVFVTNGGSDVAAISGETDSTVSDRTLPGTARAGYTFGGWYDNAQLIGDAIEQLPETYLPGTTTYYAKWTADTATIRFNVNGGSTVNDMVGTTGAKLSSTAMPSTSREGYTFAGWYDNIDCTGDSVNRLGSNFEAGVKNYYAKWNANNASITFNPAGGTFPAWAQNVGADGKIKWTGKTGEGLPSTKLPDNPSREGYSFLGWFDGSDSELTNENIGTTFPAGDKTYDAKWQLNGNGLFMFNTNGGSRVDDMTGVAGTSVAPRTMPVTTREGYTFAGWYGNAQFTGNAVTVLPEKYDESATTYYAKWTADEATIQFVTNGGSAAEAMTGVTDEAIADTHMPSTAREGYTLEGWYSNADFTGGRVEALPEAFPAGTTTYYAKWTADEARIQFVSNGGGSVADVVSTTGADVSAVAMPVPTRDGYTFAGWFDGEGESAKRMLALPTSMPAGITTYYAKWTADAAYIVFDSQWATEHDVTIEGTTGADVREGATIPSFEDGARAGYTFEGWFDESGNEVAALPATFPAGTTVYTARWVQNGNGLIEFYTNGGSDVASLTGIIGTSVATTSWPTTTRDGYTFDGWFSDAALTQAAGEFPKTYEEGTLSFYAKWLANPATIAFESNGGSGIEERQADSPATR